MFLPEVLAAMKDPNRRSRKMAGEFLITIGKKVQEVGQFSDLVTLTSAGLAGSSSLMKSESIAALGVLM